MSELTIQVLVCPHQSLLEDEPQAWWLRPSGLELELVEGQTGKVLRETTDALGNARFRGVAADEDHELRIVGPAPGVPHDLVRPWRCPSQELRFVPAAGSWLMLLEMCTIGPHGRPEPLTGVEVDVTDAGVVRSMLPSTASGHVLAFAQEGRNVTITVHDFLPDDGGPRLVPVLRSYQVQVPGAQGPAPEPLTIFFEPEATVRIRPLLEFPDGHTEPIPDLMFELSHEQGGAPRVGTAHRDQGCVIHVPAGSYRIRPVRPMTFRGNPLVALEIDFEITVEPGAEVERTVSFAVLDAELIVVVRLPGGLPADSVPVTLTDPAGMKTVVHTDAVGEYRKGIRSGQPWRVSVEPTWTLGPDTYLVDGPSEHSVTVAPRGSRTIVFPLITEVHAITGRVVDPDQQPVPNVVVDAFYADDTKATTAVTGDDGTYQLTLAAGGKYYVAVRYDDGRPARRIPVVVNSVANLPDFVVDPLLPEGEEEAIVDLAAYPVLTEEISTRGGGARGADASAPGGEGTAVEQVIRDVLGWRPRPGDVTGFRAALAGSFDLKQVEGHVTWDWKPRGYAVQADMGAVTGAQASIYARARNALEQILPLLDGLTPLDPTVEAEDVASIRAVVRSELQELVNQLAVEGGPLIQQVDSLFLQLTGVLPGDVLPDPDAIDGQLGVLAQRFGLTPDRVNTLDDERVVTNFRIIVEHVLALAASWQFDRNLFFPSSPTQFLGTALIRLSRLLEVIGEGVDDLEFALDSVFIGPAERQVLQLDIANTPSKGRIRLSRGRTAQGNVPDQAPVFLGDLLAWVRRAATVEGPQLIQDAGKDGVIAFATVLEQLRDLVAAAAALAQSTNGTGLPPGFGTPRVQRTLKELATQLHQAAEQAAGVRRRTAPRIASAAVVSSDNPFAGRFTVKVVGSNIRDDQRDKARLELSAPGMPRMIANLVDRRAYFSDRLPTAEPGTTWVATVINADGTRSNSVDVVTQP